LAREWIEASNEEKNDRAGKKTGETFERREKIWGNI